MAIAVTDYKKGDYLLIRKLGREFVGEYLGIGHFGLKMKIVKESLDKKFKKNDIIEISVLSLKKKVDLCR